MKTKKNRIVLSAVSVLLVFSLLVGGTMAWFTDTEKVNGNFTAGVLDIEVNPGKDGYTTTEPLEFENLRPMRYTNFENELEPKIAFGNELDNNVAANGMQDSDYRPVPVYFKPLQIENRGTLPTKVQISVNLGDPCEDGEEKIELSEDKNTVNWAHEKNGNCTNGLQKVLKIFLYKQEAGGWKRIENVNLNKLYDDAVADPEGAAKDNTNSEFEKNKAYMTAMIPAGENASYVIAGYLPETVGNEYQGKHYHADVMFNAYQIDDSTGGDPDSGSSEKPDPETYDYTIHHYLLDTTTSLKADTTGKAAAGELTYTPGNIEKDGKTYVPVQDSYTYTVTKTSADNEFVAYYQEKTPETVEVLLQIQYADVEAPETILKNANTDVMAVKAGDVITKTETDAFVASNLPSNTESYKYVLVENQSNSVTYPDDFVYETAIEKTPYAKMKFLVKKVTINTDFAGGDGSENDPFLITNDDQLNNVRKYMDKKYYFKVGNDFSISEVKYEDWNPLGRNGSSVTRFIGVFDGDGYTISGFHANNEFNSVTGKAVGLFADIETTGVVKNLNFVQPYSFGNDTVGVIAGMNRGLIENCHITGGGKVEGIGESTAMTIGNRVGGIVGENAGTVRRCSSSTEAVGYINIGSLVGINFGTIEECYATGGVNTAYADYAPSNQLNVPVQYVGGLVGNNQRGATIVNCYNDTSASVIGYNGVGGFLGYNAGTVQNCYSRLTGNVLSNSQMIAHRCIGSIDAASGANPIATNVYYESNYTTANVQKGVNKTAAQLKSGNLTGIQGNSAWVSANNAYPKLAWEVA